MVTLQTADNALKSFYLDAVAEALNTKANPLLAKIQKTTSDVVGKDVKKLVKVGLNGGIGAGSETGDLPSASSSDYVQFTSTLKNLYGTIEISDKAIRASANNEGAFVNLLNDEMQSLVKSASFSFGRMLFGNGSGKIAMIDSILSNNWIRVDSVGGLEKGMIVNFYNSSGEMNEDYQDVKILAVDKPNKSILLGCAAIDADLLPLGTGIFLQKSYGYEITGLDAIFSETVDTIYGVDKAACGLEPYMETDVAEITVEKIETVMDKIEEYAGSRIDFIVCSPGVKRAVVAKMREANINVATMEMDGFKAIDFFGVPMVSDRFCPAGTMYLLNTDDFKLHQLCDWQWLEGEDGKILKQIPGKPVYTATLVKYAELMCERPNAQAKLSGITEA